MQKTARERLKDYCDRHGYKQYELAEMLGITDAYLSQVLSGARRPGLPIAAKIEDVAGIQAASWMLTASGKRPKKHKTDAVSLEVGLGKIDNGRR